MPVPQYVVLDTCVLLSNVLRRVLLHLARHDCFVPVWSDVIGDEWRRNAARIWNVPAGDIAQQWNQLQTCFPDANQSDIEPYKTGLHYSDSKDWHVIAAARAALARQPAQTVAIITRNTRDFNRTELRRLGLSLLDPDTLLFRCERYYADIIVRELEQICSQNVHDSVQASVSVMLKRERLFRLNKRYLAMSGTAH